MKRIMHIFAGLCAALFVAALLLSVIRGVALNKEHYMDQYEKNGTAAVIGTDEAGLSQVTDELIRYLAAEDDVLDVQIPIHGKLQPFYNQREVDHMVDVQNVMSLAHTVSLVVYGLCAACAIAWAVQRKRLGGFPAKAILVGFGVGLVALVAIALYAYLDFSSFWTAFHHVIFTNDLWILNPMTDNLINLVPLPFFFATCMKIILWWAGLLAVFALGTFAIGHYTKPRANAHKGN